MPDPDGRDEPLADSESPSRPMSPYLASIPSASVVTPDEPAWSPPTAITPPAPTSPAPTASAMNDAAPTPPPSAPTPLSPRQPSPTPVSAPSPSDDPAATAPVAESPALPWAPVVASAPPSVEEGEPTPAQAAEPAPTDVMEPTASAGRATLDDTQAIDELPAPVSQPSPPWAAIEPSPGEQDSPPDAAPTLDAESELDSEPEPEPEPEAASPVVDRNWMGVTAFITGALLLSIVAVVLGHLGLSAAKKGRANNRTFSIAGLILGYVGLIVTAIGVWFLVAAPASAAAVDVQAQQDVSAVGAAAATLAAQTGSLPDVGQAEGDFRVGDETFTPHLDAASDLTLTGTTATDWCLAIAYEGGTETAFHYVATSGMAPGPCPAAG